MTKHVHLPSLNLKSRNSYFGPLSFLVLAILILTGSKSRANDGNRELKDIEIDALAAKMGIPLTDAAAERKRREEEENLRRERVQAEAVRFKQRLCGSSKLLIGETPRAPKREKPLRLLNARSG